MASDTRLPYSADIVLCQLARYIPWDYLGIHMVVMDMEKRYGLTGSTPARRTDG